MYSISRALKKYRGLIKWTAYHYSIRGNFRMTVADLEAEGLLILVKCCREFPEGRKNFGKYFKTAWYNHVKEMFRFNHRLKREGQEVELEEGLNIPVQYKVDPFFERMVLRANELSPLLSEGARRLLQMLVQPSGEVMEEAWRDYCRKRKLLTQGVHVVGVEKCRIKVRHIRRAMGVTPREMRLLVQEIRSANSNTRGAL